MSIGNLKDYGNKGNNFPFQKKVLSGLSLGRLGELKELVTSETNILDLQTNIDALFAANPNAYLVSKTVFHDGTDYIAFITIRV
jgi:hypothetical protein